MSCDILPDWFFESVGVIDRLNSLIFRFQKAATRPVLPFPDAGPQSGALSEYRRSESGYAGLFSTTATSPA
jgi:hypothetical protein